MSGKIIVFANQKGGVGKTTSAVNVGAFIAETGKKVLLIDFDPQGNMSSSVGSDKDKPGIYEVITGKESMINVIQETTVRNLNIVSSNVNLAGANVELIDADRRDFFLKDAVEEVIDNWDYAAKAKDQNVIVYQTGGSYVIIGPKLSDNIKSALDFVIEKGVATTSKIAKKFDVTPQNASARMKKLYDLGLVLCSKETAETGGPEFVYRAIK